MSIFLYIFTTNDSCPPLDKGSPKACKTLILFSIFLYTYSISGLNFFPSFIALLIILIRFFLSFLFDFKILNLCNAKRIYNNIQPFTPSLLYKITSFLYIYLNLSSLSSSTVAILAPSFNFDLCVTILFAT